MKKLLIFLSILTISTNKDKKYCDIKGNVFIPGVYEIKENYTIQDVINDAGGLKKNSYTDNINLSKKVNDEMVIYIFNKDEITIAKKSESVCNCSPIYKYIECENEESVETTTTIPTTIAPTKKPITTTKETTMTTTFPTTTITTTQKITTSIKEELNNKININTATLEELKTLKGLGESKAKNIIEYRNNFGLFKSIEDILNVSGIGTKTFESIKDFIEI